MKLRLKKCTALLLSTALIVSAMAFPASAADKPVVVTRSSIAQEIESNVQQNLKLSKNALTPKGIEVSDMGGPQQEYIHIPQDPNAEVVPSVKSSVDVLQDSVRASLAVGSEKTFKAMTARNVFSDVEFELAAKGTRTMVYVAKPVYDNIDSTVYSQLRPTGTTASLSAQAIAAEVDTIVTSMSLSSSNNYFGPYLYTEKNEDKKINILLFDIEKDGNLNYGVFGYFNPNDYSTAPSSNGAACLYLDVGVNQGWYNFSNTNNIKTFYGTGAHELQHLINFSSLYFNMKRWEGADLDGTYQSRYNMAAGSSTTKPEYDEVWLDEGLAGLADFKYTGNYSTSHFFSFLGDKFKAGTGYTPTDDQWAATGNNVYANYGSSVMMLDYFDKTKKLDYDKQIYIMETDPRGKIESKKSLGANYMNSDATYGSYTVDTARAKTDDFNNFFRDFALNVSVDSIGADNKYNAFNGNIWKGRLVGSSIPVLVAAYGDPWPTQTALTTADGSYSFAQTASYKPELKMFSFPAIGNQAELTVKVDGANATDEYYLILSNSNEKTKAGWASALKTFRKIGPSGITLPINSSEYTSGSSFAIVGIGYDAALKGSIKTTVAATTAVTVPTIISTTPGDGAKTGTSLSAIKVEFSEAMDTTKGTITITPSGTTVGTITWAGNVATVTLSGLVAGTNYQVDIKDFKSASGVAVENKTITFATVAAGNPYVTISNYPKTTYTTSSSAIATTLTANTNNTAATVETFAYKMTNSSTEPAFGTGVDWTQVTVTPSGSSFNTNVTPNTLEGDNYIHYYVKNSTGETVQHSVGAYKIDNTTPVITASAQGAGNTINLTVVVTDNLSGVASTKWMIKAPSDSTFVYLTSQLNYQYTAVENGVHLFKVIAADVVGNTSETTEMSITTPVTGGGTTISPGYGGGGGYDGSSSSPSNVGLNPSSRITSKNDAENKSIAIGTEILSASAVDELIKKDPTKPVVIELTAQQAGATISNKSLVLVNENNQTITISRSGVRVTVPSSILKSDDFKGGNIVIKINGITDTELKKVFTSMDAKKLGNSALVNVAEISVDVGGKAIDKFNDFLKIEFTNLPSGTSNEKSLTGFRHNSSRNKIDFLGGTTSKAGEVITFETNQMSKYGVIVNPKLVRVNLNIDSSQYKVNGVTSNMDVAPYIDNSRTMVPLRVVAEALDAKIDWTEATQTVVLNLDGSSVKLVIGQTIPGMDTPAIIQDGRTMVPIRYISENLGANVVWKADSQTIEIYK